MTRTARRIVTLLTSSLLLAGLLAGTPSSVRAAHGPSWYVAKEGVDYTGVDGCDDPDLMTGIFASDDLAAQAIADNESFLSGHEILFCEGDYLFSSEVYINEDDVSIGSAGDATVTIAGSGDNRLFEVNGEVNVSNITLTDGWVGGTNMGGAILADAINVTNVTFEDNYASGGGGAIAAYDFGNISIIMSDFNRNSANDMGGAVGTYGTVHIVGSDFSNNVSHADTNCQGGGGAIAAGGRVDVLDGNFRGNRAEVDAEDLDACYWYPIHLVQDPYDGALGGLGGAIATIGNVEVEGAVFTDNFAEAGGGAIMAAGIAWNLEGSRTCADSSVVTGSTFTKNSTNPRLGRLPISDAIGGGVLFGGGAVLSGVCQINVEESTFSGNSTMAVGGAINGENVFVSASTFTSNSVKGSLSDIPRDQRFGGSIGGGAIAAIQTQILYSTFTRNTAPSGGAVLTVGGCLAAGWNTFTGNQATGRGAGFGGGAVHALQLFCSSIFVENVFTSNVAASDGGALWGGIWMFGDELTPAQIQSIIEAPNGWAFGNTMSRNRAANGGAIAVSTRLPTRVRYSTRPLERANRIAGNSGGRNPVLAVVNWGP